MGLRKIIHNAIAAELEQGGYGLQWVDLWKGQIDSKKEEQYPFNFPAGFISIGRILWQDMTSDGKEGTVNISVYLFFDKYGDTFEGASDKNLSLGIINVVDLVSDGLHWIEGSPFKELTQVGEEDLTDRYTRPAYRLDFETIVYKQVNQ